MTSSAGPATVFWLVRHAADVPTGDDWLAPAERERQALMRFERRREDWRLGRWAAKAAVRLAMSAGRGLLRPAEIEIRSATDGAPEVFVGGDSPSLSISLSHRSGRAICAVSLETVALGCDLELVESRARAFVEDFFTREERADIEDAGGAPIVVTAMWSAKESALKSMRTGLRSDTRDVRVRLGSDGRDEEWQPLRVDHVPDDRALSGWWLQDAPFVMTLVADGDVSRPVPLEAC
jgi:4'-phosphopantetheinyl transferase